MLQTKKCDTPGKPMARDIKSDSITLAWTTPTDFDTDDYYQIRYKAKGGKWRFFDEQPSVGTTVVTSLTADTVFVFQVRVVHDDMEGPYSPISDEFCTRKSPANILFGFSEKMRDGPPDVYKLPVTENVTARNTTAKTKKFDLGE